jgi:predicted Zn-dependent protease
MRLLPISFKATILVSFLLLFNQCSRNPVTGKRELSFMSESQEKALGASSDPQIQAEFGVYPDEKLQAFLNEKGQAMAKISHRPTLPFQFKVMDSPVVNAFAVPGGYVYFTRGILAHFNNEAQFNGVLGHEIGHVTAKHGARSQTSQILSQVVLIGAMIASPKLAQYGQQLSQGMQLLMLKNSRDHESESDVLGVEYSQKVGYDAKEMGGFFLTLQRLSGGEEGGQGVPTFMSTHPDPGERHLKCREMATAYQQKNPANYNVRRDEYLRLIDGIIYGDDPKQGYVDANVFYHPELKFQFPIPTQWKHQNSPTQFAMGSPDQKAMMIMALGQGSSPAAAADTFVQNYKLQRISGRQTTINGLPAVDQVCQQVPQAQQGQQQQGPQQVVYVRNVMIQYNNLIYSFIGAADSKDYPAYEQIFGNTMYAFRPLTDLSRINVLPERVRVKQVMYDATVSEVLKGFGTPDARLNELSILNGMKLTDRISRGTLIKTVSK